MTKIITTSFAALLCLATLAGAAEAATRYRNSSNATAPGPMVHKPMMGHMMMHHRMRRHHMMHHHMMHKKMM